MKSSDLIPRRVVRPKMREAVSYSLTVKAMALAFPREERIPMVCKTCHARIDIGGIVWDAATDIQHECQVKP